MFMLAQRNNKSDKTHIQRWENTDSKNSLKEAKTGGSRA